MVRSRSSLSPGRLLFWTLAGAAAVQLLLWYATERRGFSPIFWYLLKVHDTHGNLILAAAAVLAFLLRRRGEPLALVRLAADRPWLLAGITFFLLCAGSLRVYEAYPLSMDEYSTYFQGQVFAAGKLNGAFPPELLDRLIPRFFQGGGFFRVSPATGAVATGYWPGFALLLAPFSWLGIPWAANPMIAALTIPAIHGIAREATGSREAAGWAALLTLASPVFVITSISLYSMPAHLLCGVWYAWLLLNPTPRRAALAGFIGSLALTLHFPFRHVLFAAPFVIWLLWRPDRVRMLGALAAGYVPLGVLLGLGWHFHLMELVTRVAPAADGAPAAQAAAGAVPAHTYPLLQAIRNLSLPSLRAVDSRLAGLSKIWTWDAAALMVLAAYGAFASWRTRPTRLLGAVLAASFFGYLIAAADQGHGWGNRSLYQAWFVVPLLAARALAERAPAAHADPVRVMAAWGIALSLVLANGLRLLQVDSFIEQHLRQVPPLARAPDPERPEIIFVNIRAGFYTQDMIHNDPFLRGPRVVMVLGTAQSAEALMASRFPAYRKKAEGEWGQWWERAGPR
jgi:hypothetical protein